MPITTYVRIFEESRLTVKQNPSEGVRIVCTPNNIATVQVSIKKGPRRSILQHAITLGI